MLTLWPLVAIKAYGRLAGICAIAIDVAVLAAMFAGFASGLITTVPVLTPLGVLIVAQYLYWRRRKPTVFPTRAPLEAALRTSEAAPTGGYGNASGNEAATWVALHDGRIVGTGDSPGTARRAARAAGVTDVPVTALQAGVLA
jgi:hypothetical protein